MKQCNNETMKTLFIQLNSWEPALEFKEMVGGRAIEEKDFKEGDQILVKLGSVTDLGKIVKIATTEALKKTEETEKIATTEALKKTEETEKIATTEALRKTEETEKIATTEALRKTEDTEKIATTEVQRTTDSEPSAVARGEIRLVLRKAHQQDLEKQKAKAKQEKKSIETCQKLVEKYKLPMKIVGAHLSFDGGKITFAFSAPQRIDFRDAVKDLTSQLHKSVRLYQLGAREEVGLAGDIGPCGRPLCCISFLKKLEKVGTDLIFDQQLAHRGIERVSGVCGRLKCCLRFEESLYQELTKNLPALDSQVKTERGEGKVVGQHILKQSVDVKLESGTVVEIPIQEIRDTNYK